MKPFYKCSPTSEGLLHVAAWYHGTPDQSSRNSGNKLKVWLARFPTLTNFVVWYISVMLPEQ